MNKVFQNCLLAILLAASGTLLAAEHDHMPNSASAAQAGQWADGVVIKVNEKRGKLTLQHGNIEGVMPAMTMAYEVQHVQVLKSLHKGDRVRFVLQQQQDKYLITQIELVK
ncbi:MAG: copper-binding protein [Gallionella sp.]|nr:copper-binding protein [Gallionella sp.]MDD4946514.1 copper-binding protein [Gallionella sp.]MDD5613230.1 copper-binding protein [Gallionella sp.]